MPRRSLPLVVVPAVLFALVPAAIFSLAKWHPAKRESSAPSAVSVITEPRKGEQLFAARCATCHGDGGEGGGIGPTLAGNDVSIADARSTIENGSGVMPRGLVRGQELEDVLGYLRTILGSTSE